MNIEVSTGEIVDKYSILQIKSEKICNRNKLNNIHKELKLLSACVAKLGIFIEDVNELRDINLLLWDVEDLLRTLEEKGDFGSTFVESARKVYKYNDERYRLKMGINAKYFSNLQEEKSYNG